MIELYPNIKESFRQEAEFTFNMATQQNNYIKAAKTLMDFINNCYNDEEREYASLVFYAKLMERLNQ